MDLGAQAQADHEALSPPFDGGDKEQEQGRDLEGGPDSGPGELFACHEDLDEDDPEDGHDGKEGEQGSEEKDKEARNLDFVFSYCVEEFFGREEIGEQFAHQTDPLQSHPQPPPTHPTRRS